MKLPQRDVNEIPLDDYGLEVVREVIAALRGETGDGE